MATDRYDEALIQILQAEGKIMPFLDVVFGFLQRRTDFYHEHTQPSEVGFPPGVAERLVVTTFRKWRQIQLRSAEAAAPPAVAEEEVMTSPTDVTPLVTKGLASPAEEGAEDSTLAVASVDGSEVLPKSGKNFGEHSRQTSSVSAPVPRADDRRSADTHNGAARDSYSWSQTVADLTVHVPVPKEVRRARHVSVQLHCDRVSVGLAGGAELMSGRLHRAVRAEESTWSLLPGDGVQLSLEKAKECWWKALLEQEPEIDLKQIEAVKPWEDLSQEEQMKVNELRAREEAKRRPESARPAAAGRDVTAMLREAWDAEGSPFKGQPFDPSAVQITPGAGDGGTGGSD